MNIAQQLQAWRQVAGLTQKEAAAALGVTLRTLENWEQGFSQPRGLARTTLEKFLEKKVKSGLDSTPQIGDSVSGERKRNKRKD